MSDLSWVNEATDWAFVLGKQFGEQYPEMPFCHTPHWTEFQERYQDELTTAPEELALKHLAGTAYVLGHEYPEYRGWNDLAAAIATHWPSRQEAFRRVREKAGFIMQINPDDVENQLGLLLDDMGFSRPIGASTRA